MCVLVGVGVCVRERETEKGRDEVAGGKRAGQIYERLREEKKNQ